ncbi:hypothetical protein E8E14_001928 [Neopestalotiopsis sp. 37M]|nr:hypothetical protein E8E14_001928 [Neopestalotiopsis sp. 37M]
MTTPAAATPTTVASRARTALALPASDGQLRDWIKIRVKEEFQDEFFNFFTNEESIVLDNMFEWSEAWHLLRLREMLMFLTADPLHWEWAPKKGREAVKRKANGAVHQPCIAVDCLVNEHRQRTDYMDIRSVFQNMYQMDVIHARRIREMATSSDPAIPDDIKDAFVWAMKFIDRSLDWKQNVCQHEGNAYKNPQRARGSPPIHEDLKKNHHWMPLLQRRMAPFEATYKAFLERLNDMLTEAEQPITGADGVASRAIQPATWDAFESAIADMTNVVRCAQVRPGGLQNPHFLDLPTWPVSVSNLSDITAKPIRPASACRPKKRKGGGGRRGDDSPKRQRNQI